MLERRMAWYALDRVQAQEMARGAVERALFELRNRQRLDDYNNQNGYVGLDQRWARVTDVFDEAAYYEEGQTAEFADDSCVYRIEDCASRISLNHAPRELLDEIDALRFSTLDKVMDRRERDRETETIDRFMSVEELREFESIDEDVWRGDISGAGLRDILTVWGQADGRININTAPGAVLRLIPDIDEGVVEALLDYRLGQDGVQGTRDDGVFGSLDGIGRAISVSAEKVAPLQQYCTTYSTYYEIQTRATRRAGRIKAYCTVIVALRSGIPTIVQWKEGAVAP